MTLGNLAAPWQDDLRQLLGWSAVSQTGYGLMAVVAVQRSHLVVASLLFFLAAYVVGNVAASFGVVVALRGRTDRGRYAGRARRRPLLDGILAVRLLSFIGIPPLAGFGAVPARRMTDVTRPGPHPRASRRRRMLLVAVTVVTVAAGCASGRPPTDPETMARGQEIYEASCAGCHGGTTGGAISDIPPPHNAEGHTWHHGDCVLAEIIREGPAPRPEAPEGFPTMPAFGEELGDDDIAAVLAYLRTWWTEEQREFQNERTREDCNGR